MVTSCPEIHAKTSTGKAERPKWLHCEIKLLLCCWTLWLGGLVCLAGPNYDFVAERRKWAFRSPADSPVPKVNDASWARSPIDRFILAKL